MRQGFIERALMPSEGEHAGALAGKKRDGRATDPRGPAGYEDPFALEACVIAHGHSHVSRIRPLAGG